MVQNQKFSPKTIDHKKRELEKWVEKERQTLNKARKDIEKSILSTFDTITKT